ncbi:hypothetical protein EOC93_03755 [Mesorhizobium sp. M6A.T.Ce.TU.002.03.1.1]|uniref:hypothetical protein n=1 Tax=Mesorhizobium sp. M6A.T.Ce.TU.002.03.1.1 TaxID=2496782 RepID=UPI000FCB05AE|nr:hypothetical protein [Mesorhizobium sp. M6A.T.Ce.TU.002.03.1.1]RUU46268.1 hypothetical protein EOC93_03755 [Mesorhizobium sp. M6A.T.Ce.TU.002.03.1.1]RWQ44454.1 MAG: hypothetical protein EOS21_00355 [Mesorhizobium sp.]
MLSAQKDFAHPDLLAKAIRALSVDAVENATNPVWPDRDRVVLSNGHGSMLLQAVEKAVYRPLEKQQAR